MNEARGQEENTMFSHVMLGSNDIARSKTFYDAIFATLGGPEGVVDSKGRLIYLFNGAAMMLTPPIDGNDATHANGGTIGFGAKNEEQIDNWARAGAASGGTAIEDPPGYRYNDFGALYLAYLRDPDGNKLCAAYRKPPE